MAAQNTFYLRVTKGDPVYQVIRFTDLKKEALDLTDATLSLAFKYDYSDDEAIFTLDFDNGMGFVDDDATGGEVWFRITGDQTGGVTVDTDATPENPVPHTKIYADLKIDPPDNVELSTVDGSRIKIIVIVEAALT